VIKRWNVRGFVVGEAVVQVLLTFFSGGAFAALKAVSRTGELADLIARVPAVERLVGAAGDLKGAGAVRAVARAPRLRRPAPRCR